MKKFLAVVIIAMVLGGFAYAGDTADVTVENVGDNKVLNLCSFAERIGNDPVMRTCQTYVDAGLVAPVTDNDVTTLLYNGTTPDAKRLRAGKRALMLCTEGLTKINALVTECRK